MLNKLEKQQFIVELTGNIMNKAIEQTAKMPESWDGIELRWYLADKFADAVFGETSKRKGKRYNEYRNSVIVDNL
jgi:hypothetical protein